MERKIIKVNSEKEFYKLTDIANSFLQKCGAKQGVLNLFVQHTTCAIKVLEGEILLLSDISTYLRQAFPAEGPYRHDLIGIRDVPVNERVNGFSHMRQMFFSTSCTIPVEDGKLMLGKWQDVFLIEFDPIRERSVVLTFIS